MTRPKGASRTANPAPAANPKSGGRAYPSLRSRNPVAYWIAILSVAAMVLSTIAVSVGAIL